MWAYESALAREQEFPNLLTEARFELPFLIASHHIRTKYDDALLLLGNPGVLLFPRQRFIHHASWALILSDREDADLARAHAVAALREAQTQESGLRYHPQLGLIGEAHHALRLQLSRIAKDRGW
jgi:hypothetical protein